MFDRSPLEHCLLENPQNSWRDTNRYSAPVSLAIHGVAVAVLLLAGRVVTHPLPIPNSTRLLMPNLSDYIPALKPGGGSGGDGSPDPASVGRLPRIALEQLTPPAAVIRAQDAKLEVEPTLVGPPEIQLPKSNYAALGDPNSVVATPSNGRGSGSGIGDHKGRGDGSGDGDGAGPGKDGLGGLVHHPGTAGVTVPKVIYSVEPEFTDAARQAKHQGAVLIGIVVDAEGRVRDPKVINALGMGLDEKALAAVQQWKFKPGTKDGHAVPVYAQVLVTFRLL